MLRTLCYTMCAVIPCFVASSFAMQNLLSDDTSSSDTTTFSSDATPPPVSTEAAAPLSLYELSVKSLEGLNIPLSSFRGRAILIVNTASQDRNSGQMNKLEDLYQKYSGSGLVILAFPSNDFMNEEPGGSPEVRAAYQEKFHVTFPILEKSHVTGANISPVYAFLTTSKTDPNFGWAVEWSFTKFLIDRSGSVVARFNTTTDPMDPKLVAAVEKALAQ